MMKNELSGVARAAEFLSAADKTRVAVLFHDDADGVCSGALLVELLHRLGAGEIKSFSTRVGPTADRELLRDVFSNSPTLVISADFSGELDALAREAVSKDAEYVGIDHHALQKYNFPDHPGEAGRVLYVNPLLDGESCPASCYVFRICSELSDFSEWEWAAALGIIEDFGAEECPDVVKDMLRRYPDLFETTKINSSELRRTTFGRMAQALSIASVWGGWQGAKSALEALLECNSPYEFSEMRHESVRKLYEKSGEVDKESERILKDFERNAQPYGRVLFYSFESGLKMKSVIATELGVRYPKNILVIAQNEEGRMKCSFRAQEADVNLDAVIRSSLAGLEGSGGGHAKAAGATVTQKDFRTFLERFVKECGE